MTNNPKTETYIRGMNAINNFYNMLHAALRDVIRDARLSASGAYVWRGYRIDEYKDLAYGQYGCQIYPDNPDKLLFQEGYKDPSHRADQFEKEHGIMQGRYYYPFTTSLDLIRTRFFDFDRDEQFMMLKNFSESAVKEALIWQRSDARRRVTGKRFLKGTKPRSVSINDQGSYQQVGIEFLDGWKYQSRILMQLKDVLERVSDVEWVRPNASIHNFKFRGMRLKLVTESETSRWSVYFDEPELVKFQIPKRRRNSYNLVQAGYFDISPNEQEKQLNNFVQTSLGIPY